MVQNLDKTARKRYGALIINMSQEGGSGKWRYQTYLSGSKKMVKRRLIAMLESGKRKRIKRALSLLLGAVVLFRGSLTVCAYENPQIVRNADADTFEAPQGVQVALIVNVGEIRYSEEAVLDFMEFVGNDGMCYDLSAQRNSNMERAGCIHNYVSGYIRIHHKNKDGSCKIDYYYADVCSKCGNSKKQGYSHTETSTKCTH